MTQKQVSLIKRTPESQVSKICSDHLLTHGQDSAKALIVTYQPVQRWAERHENVLNTLDVSLIKVQQTPNSPAESDVEEYGFDLVQIPSDLTSIALTVSDTIGRWKEREEDLHAAFCFDSITHALSEYPVENVFRFCHVVSQYIMNEGRGHFHINGEAHETEIVEQFRVVFDEVIDA